MKYVWVPPGGRGSAMTLGIGREPMWISCVCTMVITVQLLLQHADAAPVLASSLGYCTNVKLNTSSNSRILDCCLPQPNNTAIVKYLNLSDLGNPIFRERKPAHVLANDPQYVEKYNLAYQRMRALPKGDPRSWDTQWKTHCSFCNEAFMQRMLPGPDGSVVDGIALQVHFSWLFLPWHRMLLYFHERILGSLIDDDTFALPFWNWDNQMDDGANQIPALFLPGFSINNTALIDQNRNSKHFPPEMLPLDYRAANELNASYPVKTKQQIIDDNLSMVHSHVVAKVSAQDFLGGPYRNGTNNSVATVNVTAGKPRPGESGGNEILHNVAHAWVGFVNDPNHPDNEDMGTFIYAGKDPIFYSHHSNVDRLWDVWKTLPNTTTNRTRQDFDETDFLDSEFTFYDEKGDMVIVKVRDTLSSAKLGYRYTDMSASDKLWIEYEPKNVTTTQSKMTTSAWKQEYPEVDPSANNTISNTPVCFKVSRRAPTKNDLTGKQVKHKMQLTEGVVMESLKIPTTCYVRFDAFVDNPSATEVTDIDQAGFVGSFTYLPSGTSSDVMFQAVNVRFSIDNALSRLGINDYNTDITLTIVPMIRANGVTTLTFKSLRQEFM